MPFSFNTRHQWTLNVFIRHFSFCFTRKNLNLLSPSQGLAKGPASRNEFHMEPKQSCFVNIIKLLESLSLSVGSSYFLKYDKAETLLWFRRTKESKLGSCQGLFDGWIFEGSEGKERYLFLCFIWWCSSPPKYQYLVVRRAIIISFFTITIYH